MAAADGAMAQRLQKSGLMMIPPAMGLAALGALPHQYLLALLNICWQLIGNVPTHAGFKFVFAMVTLLGPSCMSRQYYNSISSATGTITFNSPNPGCQAQLTNVYKLRLCSLSSSIRTCSSSHVDVCLHLVQNQSRYAASDIASWDILGIVCHAYIRHGLSSVPASLPWCAQHKHVPLHLLLEPIYSLALLAHVA